MECKLYPSETTRVEYNVEGAENLKNDEQYQTVLRAKKIK